MYSEELGYDLLNPPPQQVPLGKRIPLQVIHRELQNSVAKQKKLVIKQLLSEGCNMKNELDKSCPKLKLSNLIAAICEHIEILADQANLIVRGTKLHEEYKDVFDPLPHYDNLSDEIHCRVILKDASKTITTRSYSCPRKYREAWKTLIQQHLDAGRICPSSSLYASPAFIVPKSDPTVLPRWVNDYRQINTNTVTDSYPLLRVKDILADAGRDKIWSKMDMTNSFFPYANASG